MLPVMVLAAGLGTRLRPLTEHCAKPLVPVGDRPALAHVLDRLRAAGATRIVVNAHHHADQVRAFVAGLGAGAGVALSEETELLGTAGGIARAAPLLGDGDVLVWNGDILADVDVASLVAEHQAPSQATLLVQPLPAGRGPVGLDAQGRVVRLRHERFGAEATGGDFLGIHVLGRALRARLPASGGLVEDVLVPALARGEEVRAVLFDAPWEDIGTVPTYLAANVAWLRARGLDRWVGPGARVGPDVVLDASVVGAGAVVSGTGFIVRSVVWPGAHAVAPLADVVVTS
ncbi:MAG TPA: sugar phosphate nucleotidyltransferase [Polyangiaceae bacterium]